MKPLLITLIFAASFTAANAQDFTLTADTMIRYTNGNNGPCADSSVFFPNYLYNNTSSTLPAYHWQIIYRNFPSGWFLCQFCDNHLCRTGTSPEISNNEEMTAADINVSDSGVLEPAIYVPYSANPGPGTGILRVKVWTENTVDTATFIINPAPTGISKIAVNDSRVNIYPNPANNNMLIYAEKSLNATHLSIISITGQTVDRRILEGSKEVNNINIHTLSKGTYMIRLTDDKGQLITSRKLIKE